MISDTVVYCSRPMSHFGKLIAGVLGLPLFISTPVGHVKRVYIIGMYDPPTFQYTLEDTMNAGERIIHWCGSDVQFLADNEYLPEATHYCVSENLKTELFEKGVDAEVVAFPTTIHPEVEPLPEEPTMAFYAGSDPDKYGAQMFVALSKVFPDVKTIAYQAGTYDDEEMKEVIKNSTVYIRFTRHDGAMASAQEFMEGGRRAIVTGDMPYGIRVRPDDLIAAVSALRKVLKHKEPDYEAAAYYHEFNSNERFIEDLKEVGFFE